MLSRLLLFGGIMLELKNITKYYGEQCIFDNFSFSFAENKVTAIMGASGIGKSTLLKIICGITDFSGTVNKSGEISCVFQTPRLIPTLTVYQNLLFVLKGKMDRETIDSEIRKYLSIAKIENLIDKYPKELSGGEAQRVSFVRAFLYPNDLLILDEPFSSLDLWLKSHLIDLFSDLLKQNNKTVLMITHDIDEALSLSDGILVLKKGGYDYMQNGTKSGNGESKEKVRESLIKLLEINSNIFAV